MRLLATDVDGTIVTSARGVTGRTADAVRTARATGVRVVLVTGRPMRWLCDVVTALGGVDGLAAANGAMVYRLPSGRLDGTELLLDRRTISPSDVVDWTGRLRAAVPGIVFGVERPAGFCAEPGYELPPTRQSAGIAIASLSTLLAADAHVVKLLAKLPSVLVTGERPGDQLLATTRRALGDRVMPVHSNSSHALVELGPPGVDKATGLAVLADSFGVARPDVVAFGDMPNDVPMLVWAGRGYAMADGHPEAIAAADATARPCDEDGVALAVEELARLAAGAGR